ncbi:hypothetical protein SmJEL517_g01090 [Synchytrium microbalum]|uniref:GDP-mannose transporter n=1 Tax=Synchytrium microbalum TaxID=1806994 RepID=A0A507CCL8_9FUNG|nr:uncharacterized protein SmJEL517_g01090 [Synchytrium microbalum]TPX37088.1 hypothetical protein SmJEL517_g01090 [Synchytrium microbalum]
MPISSSGRSSPARSKQPSIDKGSVKPPFVVPPPTLVKPRKPSPVTTNKDLSKINTGAMDYTTAAPAIHLPPPVEIRSNVTTQYDRENHDARMLLKVVPAISAYCASSIFMTVTNKLTLYYFRIPTFLMLAAQTTISLLLLEAFTRANWVKHRRFNASEAAKWMPVALALVAMTFSGFKALEHLSIPIFQIFKNLTIIIIAYAERHFYSGSPVTVSMFFSFTLMVFSSILGAIGDSRSTFPTTHASSYFWMLINIASTAYYTLIMRSRIRQSGFKDFDMVYYNNILSIPLLAVLATVTETSQISSFYAKYFGSGLSALERYQRRDEVAVLIGVVLVSSASTFAISYATALCVRVTSSTTYSMVGALNKLPIAVAGMLVFPQDLTIGNVLGVLIAFLSGIIYAQAKTAQTALYGLSPNGYIGGDEKYSPTESVDGSLGGRFGSDMNLPHSNKST